MRSDSSALAVSMMIGMAAVVGVRADRAAQLQAVESRQHQVEHDQVGRLAFDLRHHLAARRDDGRQKAGLFQVMLEQAPDVGIVFGDEDPCGRPH